MVSNKDNTQQTLILGFNLSLGRWYKTSPMGHGRYLLTSISDLASTLPKKGRGRSVLGAPQEAGEIRFFQEACKKTIFVARLMCRGFKLL